MREALEAWIHLPERGSTTCPEEPTHPRSECHAWSALPLYELNRTIAGIRLEGGNVMIRPRMMDLPDLRGEASTPLGMAAFRYERGTDGVCRYEIRIPEGEKGVFVSPGGKEIAFEGTLRYEE